MPPLRVRRDNNTALAGAPERNAWPQELSGPGSLRRSAWLSAVPRRSWWMSKELSGTFALTNVRLWWSKIQILVVKVVVKSDSAGV